MRKILYILPLLLLLILPYKIYSQSPQPMWQYFCMNSVCIPTFTTQLVGVFNISKAFTSANLQIIKFTVPEQVLQQQLQYCKTYDPYVTSINASECEFAWPAVVAITNSNGQLINLCPNTDPGVYSYWTEYQYRSNVLSYDNVTGLPQTFEIVIGSGTGSCGIFSNGTYYLYIYYPSPFLFAGNSIQGPYQPYCGTNTTLDGGWCGNGGVFTAAPYDSTRTIWAGNGIAPNGAMIRTLNVYYNPSYPVIIGANPMSAPYATFSFMYVVYSITNPSTNSSVNVCIVSTLSAYFSDCNIYLTPGFYDLRQVLINNGADPNQYNEISSITVSGFAISYFGAALNAIYLEYTPANS
ncbi:MAG: hypothetical protein ACP5GJ_04000 [Nanopusillaceae archaeon]